MTKTAKRKTKKYGDPLFSFELEIRDEKHFVKVIETLNRICGIGMENWTITNKVRKKLRHRINPRVPVKSNVLIFNGSREVETMVKLL